MEENKDEEMSISLSSDSEEQVVGKKKEKRRISRESMIQKHPDGEPQPVNTLPQIKEARLSQEGGS